MNWLTAQWATVRGTIAAGDVRAFERRYVPAAIVLGIVIGGCLSLLSKTIAVIIVLAVGFALGYAARAYLSHRRRIEYLRQHGERL